MKTQTLQRQFRLWTVILVVVPSLLIMAIYTINQINIVKQKKLELISQRVDSQRRLIEYWLEERATDVHMLSQLKSFRTLDEEQMKIALELTQQNSKEFDSLSFIDRNGLFKISTLTGGIQFPSAINQPYFQGALAEEEHISDIVIGRNSGLPIINFSSPVYDNEGNFQGALLGSVRTTKIETLLRENWMGETGEILLVNRAGKLIAQPRYVTTLIEEGILEGDSKKEVKLSNEALASIHIGETGKASWTDYLGNRVMGAYQYMPELGWTLVGSVNEEEILTPIYTQLGKMAGGTLLLLFLILPLATRLTNFIKRPIDWLIDQSNLIATEKYEKIERNKELKKMPQELGNLCKSFLQMSFIIENTVGLLKENEAKLESKVVEIREINISLEKEIVERKKAQADLQWLNARLEDEVSYRTQQLQQSEQQYRKLVENSPDIICQFDKDYRFIYVNPAFTLITGISLAQAVGKTSAETGASEEYCSRWVQNLDTVFYTGSKLEIESWSARLDDQHFYSIRLIPEFNKDGQVESVLCIARDVTEKQQLERRMAQIDRLNIVGEMAAAIGHEVRNPMTTVRGYLQLFQKKEQFLKYGESLGTMIEELDRANSIITEFLSLAKNKAVDMKRGNLNKVIFTILPLLQADAICWGHEINTECSNIPDSDFDEKEIRQLILNLVRNGFEAIDDRGEVIVRTYLHNDNVVLEVQDTGKGIPNEVMDKLGIPFVTTKDGGTGLGLSVCYRIVDRHGAKIDVSTGRNGTIFTIYFNLSKSYVIEQEIA